MSIPPGQSGQPSGAPSPGYPEGGPTSFQPPPQQGTSGLAIAGLVLAFLMFPVGLILSVIALFGTGPGKKKGRGLAVAGIVVSLLATASTVGVFMLVKDEVGSIATIIDPGCTQGKDVILANGDLGGGADPVVVRAKLNTLIAGLDKAASAAKNDEVRAAMTALSGDYKQLLQSLDTTSVPDGLQSKIDVDATKIDELCTVGGAQQ